MWPFSTPGEGNREEKLDYMDNLMDWSGDTINGRKATAETARHGASVEAGETRKWRDCHHNACLDTLEHEGQTYQGCSQTPDYKDSSWCFVQGGSKCPEGKDSNHDGETCLWCDATKGSNHDGWTRKRRDCENSACLDAFENEGKMVFAFISRCCVQGGSCRSESMGSNFDGETRKWRGCDHCACMDALEVSTLEGETRKWRDCDNCACMDTYEFEGKTFNGCSQMSCTPVSCMAAMARPRGL